MLSHDRLQLNSAPGRTCDTLSGHVHVELEIVHGTTRHRQRPITVPAFLIGRAEDCDLVLADERFPEAYAYVLVRGREILLRHLGFAPAICVNGKPVTQCRLSDGDTIQAGPFEFRMHVEPGNCLTSSGDPAESGSTVPESARAAAQTKAIADALDLIRCIREEVLGESTAFRLYLGPEGHLATLPALARLPVDSAAFSGRITRNARSA